MPSRKGSPNKNRQFALNKLKEVFGNDFDPVIRMAENAVELQKIALTEKEPKTIKDALDGWDKVAAYTSPKLKAVELSGGLDLVAHEKALDELE